MSDYRRLISYIYAYEGGVKGKNIGFAKLEARGDQCKIQVSVRKIYVGSQDVGVYLLSASSEILLGRIFLRGGSGDFRTIVSFRDVNGSGQGMEQCYGLTLHSTDDTWRSYTTIWEDAVAHAAAVDLEEVTAKSAQEQEMKKVPSDEITDKALEELKSQKQESVVECIEREVREQEEKETEDQKESASHNTAEEQPPRQRTEEQPPRQPEQEPPRQPEEIPPRQVEEVPLQQAEEIPQPDSAEPSKQDEAGRLWTHFQRHYPKIQAFDYNGGCEILLIKPQDIGLLPRETWNYGNNSFLLHGYYNHRYLILARLVGPKGEVRFLLGVPGHYYNNEKYMASMFGFPNFVLSKMQPAGDGRFGYWYTDIRIADQ